MRTTFIILLIGLFGKLSFGQQIDGLPQLQQIDSTAFNLTFNTDTAAIITVHVAEDTTYSSAFIFLGRTVGDMNEARIQMDGLRNNANYHYRVFLGTTLSSVSGTFETGSSIKE